jgi:hypothetical protein
MKYVHGFMDRVHGNAIHRLTDFIKPECPNRDGGLRSTKQRVRLFFNLIRYGEDGRRGSNWPLGVVALGHQHDDRHCSIARASRSSALRLPRVWRLELFGLTMRGHRGYSPWVQSWRGKTPRLLTVAA